MLTLIATLCFMSQPAVCSNVEISLVENVSMIQCFMGAQPTAIEYLKHHPFVEYQGRTYNLTNFSLDRLTCKPVEIKGQPDKGF